MILWLSRRAIAFFKMRIGWHGLGVLTMAVSLADLHGHPEDGKSVAPQIEKGDCLGLRRRTRKPEIVRILNV